MHIPGHLHVCAMFIRHLAALPQVAESTLDFLQPNLAGLHALFLGLNCDGCDYQVTECWLSLRGIKIYPISTRLLHISAPHITRVRTWVLRSMPCLQGLRHLTQLTRLKITDHMSQAWPLSGGTNVIASLTRLQCLHIPALRDPSPLAALR